MKSTPVNAADNPQSKFSIIDGDQTATFEETITKSQE